MIKRQIITQLEANASNSSKGVHLVDKNLDISDSLSYEKLWARSLCLAHHLTGQGIKENDNVLLLYSPGVEFIAVLMAIQIIGAVPIPTYPPFSKSGFLRLLSIKSVLHIQFALVDDQVNTLLFSQSMMNNNVMRLFMRVIKKGVYFNKDDFKDLSQLKFINTNSILTETINPDSVKRGLSETALIQFTSGSISEPKGVILTHENLISNIEGMQRRMKLTTESKIFCWVPQYHDMGLIGGILTSIYTGSDFYIMSPFDFVRRPLLWIKALDKFKITHSCGPNFAYEICVKRADDETLKTLDLSSVQILINGAEPIKLKTVNDFIKKFESCGLPSKALTPAYGLAESSLLINANIA